MRYSGTRCHTTQQHIFQAPLQNKCCHLSVLHRSWVLLDWELIISTEAQNSNYVCVPKCVGFIFLLLQSIHRWLCSPETIHRFFCFQSTDRCELLQQRDCTIILLLHTIWFRSTMYCSSLHLLQHREIQINYEHLFCRVFYSPLVRDSNSLKLKILMYPQFIKEELSYRAPKWHSKIPPEDHDRQESLNLFP